MHFITEVSKLRIIIKQIKRSDIIKMQDNILTPSTAQGVKDFRTLIEESTVIIDKSMLIKAFLRNKDETALITYPRRWGKTINLSMVKTFFELEVDNNGVPLPDEQKKNIAILVVNVETEEIVEWINQKNT